MPWADTVFQDWSDCVWQDWSDCEWDKFCISYQDAKTRSVRQFYESHVQKKPVRGPRQLRSGRTGRAEYEWRWLGYLDNTRWTANIGYWLDIGWVPVIGWHQHYENQWQRPTDPEWWDGEKWVIPGVGSHNLFVKGTWYPDYSPSAVKVTYTCTNGEMTEFKVMDEEWDGAVGEVDNYVSDDSLSLIFKGYDMKSLRFQIASTNGTVSTTVTNVRFLSPVVELSALGVWAKNLRPEKLRMTFEKATANVSVRDSNGVELCIKNTCASGEGVHLNFAGADIDKLIVCRSGKITDIEFLVGAEKGAYQRTIRKQLPGGLGNVRRPYLEGNPSYVEDSRLYPDAALASAMRKSTGEIWPHMKFKQPYRYEGLQRMKYRGELSFPHEEERGPEKPRQILFPDPPAFPEPAFPESDPISGPDPIPGPATEEGCPRATRPRFRPSRGATAWIHPGWKCEKGKWVIKR